MPLRTKRLTAALLAAGGALLLLAPAGNAATTFGSRLKNDPTTGSCVMFPTLPSPNCTLVDFTHPVDPNGDPNSTGAPVDGVITKFRIRAFGDGSNPGTVTFRVADINRPNPSDTSSALAASAGTGPTVTIPSEPNTDVPILQFAGRLPVRAGQHLAIDETNVNAIYASSGAKDTYVFSGPLVDGAGARGSNAVTEELLVQADIEPDADKDGFGDETQDQCPSQATTQGPCDKAAPAVSGLKVSNFKVGYVLSEAATVGFKLQKATTGRRVNGKCVRKTRRNSSRPRCTRFTGVGGSFAGPGNVGPNQVSLPKVRGRKLGPGLYRLTMTATDAVGNSGTTTKQFRIKPPKKKH
jgi:hypothetical protein